MLFRSGENFFKQAKKHTYHIVFLETNLPTLSGLEIANKIKTTYPSCKMIFLTESSQYITDSFMLHATCYILKPLQIRDLQHAISLCFPYSGTDNLLSVSVNKHTRTVLRDDIIYIDYMSRCTQIHTAQELIRCYDAFTSITNPLETDPRFLLCRRGVMVNLRHVLYEDNGDLYMTTGDILPCSRNQLDYVVQALYHLKKLS